MGRRPLPFTVDSVAGVVLLSRECGNRNIQGLFMGQYGLALLLHREVETWRPSVHVSVPDRRSRDFGSPRAYARSRCPRPSRPRRARSSRLPLQRREPAAGCRGRDGFHSGCRPNRQFPEWLPPALAAHPPGARLCSCCAPGDSGERLRAARVDRAKLSF